ncbi:hypothetical protein SAMN05421736_10655 [Evansella caseinilytica]|uniref:Uncharacterized protein n=1 Tax=Evansella caseinilytica TaxID=1503961 RepID=A0A1H3Q8W7_9BACI|nr:hypothetical protein [Evansella caseinilytica]SDZ09528.1 hypothetical protein SAMN05421736_10655 [Evansella caseinilytica]
MTENRASTQKEQTKKKLKWPVYAMAFGLTISFLIRHGSYMFGDSSSPEPVSPELQDAVNVIHENREKEKEETIEKNTSPITNFLEILNDGTLEENISLVVSESYQDVILENIDHPLLTQLAGAQITKATNLSSYIPYGFFLLENNEEDVKAVVEVSSGKIMSIYAEGWSESEENKAKYQEMLQELEESGNDYE